jgi:RHS repeat-associated protein
VYDLGASEVPGLAPLLAEYDGNGNLVAKYHHDGGGLMAMTRNNQSYWYGFEGIGTTRQLMGSQGQVLDAYAFDAWGNELTNPQSQVQNPFKYVGKHGYYLDTESALMLLGVRYYSAANGLFLSRDLVMTEINYIYANNNPIKFHDSTGLFPPTQRRVASSVFQEGEILPRYADFLSHFLLLEAISFPRLF